MQALLPPCPLCQCAAVSLFFKEGQRSYFRCSQCDLIFLHPSAHLDPKKEKARYLEHNNDIHDPRYQEFVDPLYRQICRHVPRGAVGLDFGSGTGPVLAYKLNQAGYDTRLFDPYFHPERANLERQYDFVAACEVMEHLHAPYTEFKLLRSVLSQGGLLGVMTWLFNDSMDFARWSYRQDNTHVAFYSKATFQWIAKNFGFNQVWFPEERLALLR